MSLDSDVQRMLEQARRKRGVSFKQALNDAIRAGLIQKGPRRFVQRSFRLGSEQNFRWDKALTVSNVIEDEELLHKVRDLVE